MCCFHATATSTFYTLSLHDALPISRRPCRRRGGAAAGDGAAGRRALQHRGDRRTPLAHDGGAVRARRSEEHTSELQSLTNLVCRLLLEKKNELQRCRSSCYTYNEPS